MLNALLSLYHRGHGIGIQVGTPQTFLYDDIQCCIYGAYCAQLDFVQAN